MVDFSKINEKQFAIIFSKLIEKIKEDPINNFIKASGFINFTPTPAQTVALKIIFEKPLDATKKHKVYKEVVDDNNKFNLEYHDMTEVEIYEFMTNRSYLELNKVQTSDKINTINLIIGRRGGKTSLSAMLAIYCAISTNWKTFLQKTPFATVLILSHSREFSDEVLELIRTLIQSSPVLTKLINSKKKNTTSTMNLKIPWVLENGVIDYSRVQIKVGAASSKTTRGVAACAVLADEIAFWNLDDNLKETDEKIMKAVRPATKQFGSNAVVIKLSSPGIKQGVLYNEYSKWIEGTLPKNYIVFKSPSWVWNTILPKNEFIQEWELDPDGFNTEYRANFVDSISNFIIPEFVDMAVVKGVEFRVPENENINMKYFGAIDAAFKGDRFTFSVIGYDNVKVKQFISKGWLGSKESPVRATEVASYIRKICKEYDIPFVTADQYSFAPLREIFEQHGVILKEKPFNINYKKKIYFNLKKIIHSQQIELLDNPIQSKEIKELIVTQSNAGMVRISHPSGGHDDFADSLAIACHMAAEEAGTGFKSDLEAMVSVQTYGIQTDSNGRSFNAPSAEMLSLSGHLDANITDNSGSYIKNPKTGKLMRYEDFLEESGEDQEEDDGGIGALF